MTTEENKRVVETFINLFERSAIAQALGMMTDDATWHVIGKPHLSSAAGVQTKAQMADVLPALYSQLDGGLQMRVTGMIAEGDQVAAEVFD